MFSAKDVCRLTGCTQHQLRYWDRTGLLEPSVRGSGGRSGCPRYYSFRDLVTLKLFRDLLNLGMSTQAVRRAWTYLRHHGDLEEELNGMEQHLNGLLVFTDGSTILGIDQEGPDDGAVFDALRAGQLVFFDVLVEVTQIMTDNANGYLFNRQSFLELLQLAEDELAEPTYLMRPTDENPQGPPETEEPEEGSFPIAI